jgi:hypothetical protein
MTSITVDMKVGHWRVLRVVHRRALCRCDCGSVREVAIAALEDKSSLSCGCSALSRPKDQKARPRLVPDWRPERGR